MKTQTAFLFYLTMILTAPVFASTESHQEAAKEMMEVSGANKILNSMYEKLNSTMIENSGLFSQGSCFESIRKPFMDFLLTKFDQEVINVEDVKKEFQKLYIQEFTEAEIREVIAFYKTPTGQKLLAKEPIITAKATDYVQKEIEKSIVQEGVMDQLQNEINKLIETIDLEQLTPKCKEKLEKSKARIKKKM